MRLFSVRSWCAQWCGSHSPETDSKTENLCGKCTGGHSGTHTCRRSRTGHGRGWAGMQPQSCRRSLEVLWSWEGPAELSWVGVRGLGLQKHEPPSVTGRWMSRGGDVPLSEEAKGDFRRGLRAEACWGDGGWAAQHSSYHMWLLANLPLNIWTNQYKWKIQSQEKKSKTYFNSNIPSLMWQAKLKRCKDKDEVPFSCVKWKLWTRSGTLNWWPTGWVCLQSLLFAWIVFQIQVSGFSWKFGRSGTLCPHLFMTNTG